MNTYKTPSRDYWGRWTTGSTGNPAGRPKGAKDKKRRYRFEKKRNWDCAKNLGDYAIKGGPGRLKGTVNMGGRLGENSMAEISGRTA